MGTCWLLFISLTHTFHFYDTQCFHGLPIFCWKLTPWQCTKLGTDTGLKPYAQIRNYNLKWILNIHIYRHILKKRVMSTLWIQATIWIKVVFLHCHAQLQVLTLVKTQTRTLQVLTLVKIGVKQVVPGHVHSKQIMKLCAYIVNR